MGKIGIFGGSFNPPHLGHVLAAREMAEELGLDRLLLVPVGTPPHKDFPEQTPGAEMRLSMLRAAFRDMPQAEICEYEIRKPGKSYTADTLSILKRQFPDDELFLLMGTDMFLSLDTWYHPEVICRKAVIAAARRAGEDEIGQNAMKAQAKKLKSHYDAKVLLLHNSFAEMSSTMVRRMLAFDCAEPYLDPVVLQMIREHHLYGTGENWKGLPFDELKHRSLSLHKPERVAHVIGCSDTAVHLAEKYGANAVDARRAGILHDITKALDGKEQLLLCERYAIITDEFEKTHPKLLHAKTGAAIAEHVFGENRNVCNAICWHTTGRPHMTKLEKILYIADYMEPNRSFDGVKALRTVTEQNLDDGVLMGFNLAIAELEREKKTLCQTTVLARDFLRRERTLAK